MDMGFDIVRGHFEQSLSPPFRFVPSQYPFVIFNSASLHSSPPYLNKPASPPHPYTNKLGAPSKPGA
jgi:hypothetical protein